MHLLVNAIMKWDYYSHCCMYPGKYITNRSVLVHSEAELSVIATQRELLDESCPYSTRSTRVRVGNIKFVIPSFQHVNGRRLITAPTRPNA